MIKIEKLKKAFDDFVAVQGITFTVSEGDVLGFLGPNGAGKTTTMKMLTGYINPTAGSIDICGHDVVADALAAKQLIGYLPEGAPAYGDMTPASYLAFIGRLRGLKGGALQQRLDYVVELLALEQVFNRPIETLSKGFRRRVGIAQAILHDPKVLILDEPTDGLDPNQKHEVRKLIRNLASDKIVIISTHILEEVDAVCNRAIIIANGRIVADSTPAELASRSRYHQAVTIKGKELGALLPAIESIAGIAAIERRDDAEESYTLFPEEGFQLFEPVSALLQTHSHNYQLFIEQGQLDDVFRQLTTAQEQPYHGSLIPLPEQQPAIESNKQEEIA